MSMLEPKTVREVMEFLATCDPDAEVIPCDWGDEVCLRIRNTERAFLAELRWSYVPRGDL